MRRMINSPNACCSFAVVARRLKASNEQPKAEREVCQSRSVSPPRSTMVSRMTMVYKGWVRRLWPLMVN